MIFRRSARDARRPARRTVPTPGPEAVSELERRQLLSTTPAVVMDSATTADSRGVTVVYDVETPPVTGQPLTIGLYRSASATFDAGAVEVGSETIGPSTFDADGQLADAVGHHTLTVPLASGLTINPQHPYVLAVANPTGALASGDPQSTASFRVDSIVVVTHGGLQLSRYDTTGPPWEQIMAHDLKGQGYDAVLPFNWVPESGTAGSAALQAPRLVRELLATAAKLPSNDVVDVQFIGHSEGTVINGMAIQLLQSQMTPQIRAGWLEETLLDPHAANTGVAGQQYSVADGPLGWLAKGEIDAYQAKAKDPAVTVPASVDQAQVFYQHTKANKSQGENGNLYNLWGQVPVIGQASYFNLTGDRVTHSGDTAVYVWYTRHVVPTLGDGAPEVATETLTGSVTGVNAVRTHQPIFSGTAAPGSFVTVSLSGVGDPSHLVVYGRTVAGANGQWSLVGRPLLAGNYRAIAQALPPPHAPGRLAMVPTQPLGRFSIAPRH